MSSLTLDVSPSFINLTISSQEILLKLHLIHKPPVEIFTCNNVGKATPCSAWPPRSVHAKEEIAHRAHLCG